MERHDTKTKILDAAEFLFAKNGFKATSVRQIVAKAKANIASVHYYFGSKEDLIKEVFGRRMSVVNRERERRFENLREEYAENPPLEEILRAFIGPMLEIHFEVNQKQKVLFELFQKIHCESESIKKLIMSGHNEINKEFQRILAQSLPHLKEEDLQWRFMFTLGSIVFGFRATKERLPFQNIDFQNSDADTILNKLIPFLSAGLRSKA